MSRTPAVALLGIVSLGIALTACASNRAPKAQGNVKDATYASPAHNFSVSLPSGLGVRVNDAYDPETGIGAVSFSDDFGNLRGVLYVRVPVDTSGTLENRDVRRNMLEGALERLALPQWFLPVSPDSKVLVQEPMALDSDDDDAFVGLVRIPEGSAMMDMNTGKRLDSTRAVLTLSHGDYLYFLMLETGNAFTQVSGSETPQDSELLERSRPRLLDFYHAVKFL